MNYTPDLNCPFTGTPIEVKEVTSQAAGHPVTRFMGVGQFYTTRLYQTRRQLEWALSHRNGKAPDFMPAEAVVVTTPAERQAAADVSAADTVESAAAKKLDDLAVDFVERIPVRVQMRGPGRPRKIAKPAGG